MSISITQEMNLEQRLAKQGNLFRAIFTELSTNRSAITIVIPAGRYCQITKNTARLNENALSTGTADLKVIFGGTRTGGTLIDGDNFNALNPQASPFEVYTNATITDPIDSIDIANYAISSTNQTSDNSTYLDTDLYVFGHPSMELNITLELESTVTLDFVGLKINFTEISELGTD